MSNRGALLEKFFNNYPPEEIWSNREELVERFTAMRDAITELRRLAIAARSITQLQEVQALDIEFGSLTMMINQHRARGVAV